MLITWLQDEMLKGPERGEGWCNSNRMRKTLHRGTPLAHISGKIWCRRGSSPHVQAGLARWRTLR